MTNRQKPLTRGQIEVCRDSFLDEQQQFPEGSLGYKLCTENLILCDMALRSLDQRTYNEGLTTAQRVCETYAGVEGSCARLIHRDIEKLREPA